jgi:hypothetical protein
MPITQAVILAKVRVQCLWLLDKGTGHWIPA